MQENLLKLAARIPAFMYLTDYREQTIKDVITQIEPELFKKVTGLSVKDFDVLCSIGLFDSEKMNQGIFGFRKYENSSLSYTGIDKHEGEAVGGWDTVLRREEYEALYSKQQAAMVNFTEIIPIPQEDISTEEKKPANYGVKQSQKEKESPKPKQPENKTPSTPEEPDWMEILDKVRIGTAVYHKMFKNGTVVNMNPEKTRIVVKFEMGEKTFVFPDNVVNGFLTVL